MERLNRLILITVLLLFQACTAEQIHSVIQDKQKQECHSLPTNSQYEECVKHNNESYDEYSRNRKEIINGEVDG